jgi:hypothetical protein
MRKRTAAVSIGAMTTRHRRSLTLEIEPDETHRDSIAGRLSDEAGVRTEFTGWIGLAAAIDDALHAPAPRAGRG